MTFKEIINLISGVAKAQPNMGDIIVGDIYELNHNEDVVYPCFAITNQQHTHNHSDESTTYSLYLFYVDRLTNNKNNRTDVLSTGEQVIHSVISTLEDSGVLVEDYQFNFANQRFNDECAVVFASVRLTVEECLITHFHASSECEELEEQLESANGTIQMLSGKLQQAIRNISNLNRRIQQLEAQLNNSTETP